MADKAKRNYNDYKEHLKVFEDLFKMSGEELIAERDSAKKSIEIVQKVTDEMDEIEEYFEELDKKEALTEEEKLKRRVKEERYKQLKELEAKMEKRITKAEFDSELERYSVFVKVKEPLETAKETLEKAIKSKTAKMKEAKKKLIIAEKARAASKTNVKEVEREIAELEDYFAEYARKSIILNADRLEYDEKKARYEELKDTKSKLLEADVETAKKNYEEVKYHAEENEIMNNARKQIKFMTDKSNWKQILAMSKEELMSTLNGKQTPSVEKPKKEEKGQEEAENKPEEKGEDEKGKQKEGKGKKEPSVRTEGAARTEETPVVADRNEEKKEAEDENEEGESVEDPKEEQKDLKEQEPSIWERIKDSFTKRFGKYIEKSKKIFRRTGKNTKENEREKRVEKYIEEYKKVNEGKEPSNWDIKLAKYAPNLPQIRNILDGTEAKLSAKFKDTQAGPLVDKIIASKQEHEENAAGEQATPSIITKREEMAKFKGELSEGVSQEPVGIDRAGEAEGREEASITTEAEHGNGGR